MQNLFQQFKINFTPVQELQALDSPVWSTQPEAGSSRLQELHTSW